MKKRFLSIPILAAVLLIVGCSSNSPPQGSTPTPLPTVDQALADVPLESDPDSNADETAPAQLPDSSADEEPSLDTDADWDARAAEAVVVDSLELRPESADPFKGSLSIGGTVEADCWTIAGWEQRLEDRTIFIQPQIVQKEKEICSDLPVPFDQTIDLGLQGLDTSEVISADYFLDVHGFTMFLTPVVASSLLTGGDLDITLVEFEALLEEAVSSYSYDQLEELMDDSFGFAFWGSEGFETDPPGAIEQLVNSYLVSESTITFGDSPPDLSAIFGEGRDILSIWNPEANAVNALFSTGWGTDGSSEAFLIVSQSPEGTYVWDGIVLAHGDMGGFAGP